MFVVIEHQVKPWSTPVSHVSYPYKIVLLKGPCNFCNFRNMDNVTRNYRNLIFIKKIIIKK